MKNEAEIANVCLKSYPATEIWLTMYVFESLCAHDRLQPIGLSEHRWLSVMKVSWRLLLTLTTVIIEITHLKNKHKRKCKQCSWHEYLTQITRVYALKQLLSATTRQGRTHEFMKSHSIYWYISMKLCTVFSYIKSFRSRFPSPVCGRLYCWKPESRSSVVKAGTETCRMN